MIKSVTTTNEAEPLSGVKTVERLNHILQLIAAASIYDPGETDLDDEQPVAAVSGLDLGDVRLARRLTRTEKFVVLDRKTMSSDEYDRYSRGELKRRFKTSERLRRAE